MYKHLLMRSKIKKINNRKRKEKLEKELKYKNKESKKKIKNLANNQITNDSEK